MDLTNLFWLFLILTALQPAVKQKLLELSRKQLLRKIEKTRRTRLILLVHRQETMSFLGFPLLRYIDINDSEEVVRAIHLTDPDLPIDLVLHTPGGMVLASLQIAEAIRKHRAKVTVVVPHYAMSGGTLIALAADEILLSEHAVLGPVDPQLGRNPAASVLKVLQQKPLEKIDDRTLIQADQAGKAVAQLRAAVRRLLAENYSAETAEELAGLLTEGTWTHDFPISCEQARQLGLNVNSDVPREFLKLLRLYPQPARHRSTVEYLPERYREDGSSGD